MIVTLISPPTLMRRNNISAVGSSPPLGLAYIAGYIKSSFEIEVIDAIGEGSQQFTKIKDSNYSFYGLTIDQIISRINPNSKIIGISCMFSSNWLLHRILVAEVLKYFPSSIVVLGGEHVTAAHLNILKEFGSNVICVLGEGEETFLQVCTSLEKNNFQDLKQIKGISFKDANGQVISSRRDRIKAIDTIPWPSWDHFPMHNYLQGGMGANVHNRRVMVMLTSRGCPYKCSFCSSPQMWGTSLFHRKPECIIDEIRLYIKKYNIDHIEFMDLVGLFDKNWTIDFCHKMKLANLGIKFTFTPGTRSEILTFDILKALKEAGLLKIQYAPDSGSTEEARLLRKNANLDKMTASIRNSVKLNIPICCNVLMGYPGQRLSDLLSAIFFSFKLSFIGVNDVSIQNFRPYAGSEFHEQLKNDVKETYKDFISDEYIVITTTTSLGYVKSYSDNIPSWVLSSVRLFLLFSCLLLQYILRPQRIVMTLKNVFHKKPVTIFENLLYLKLNKEAKLKSGASEIILRGFSGIK